MATKKSKAKKIKTPSRAFLKKHHIIDAEQQPKNSSVHSPKTFVLPNLELFKLLPKVTPKHKKKHTKKRK